MTSFNLTLNFFFCSDNINLYACTLTKLYYSQKHKIQSKWVKWNSGCEQTQQYYNKGMLTAIKHKGSYQIKKYRVALYIVITEEVVGNLTRILYV